MFILADKMHINDSVDNNKEMAVGSIDWKQSQETTLCIGIASTCTFLTQAAVYFYTKQYTDVFLVCILWAEIQISIYWTYIIMVTFIVVLIRAVAAITIIEYIVRYMFCLQTVGRCGVIQITQIKRFFWRNTETINPKINRNLLLC